ncbi:MAG: helix-turn-helix domain containing protein [Rhodospirillales bacterium]|nr:helix-turn-helix domain containing protein [Rhodospirillales bacterium]
MAKRPSPRNRIITAALKLAADKPWRDVGMDDIADEANVKMDTLTREFRSKSAILAGINSMIDGAMVKSAGKPDPEETVRDRLFGLLMARFDAMQPNKAAILSMLRGTVGIDPRATLAGACGLAGSMRTALDAAPVNTGGRLGRLKINGLIGVYLATARIWMTDETDDLAPTMAALDRNLRRAGQWADMLEKGPFRRPRTEAAQES